jgi:hypothetical protein
VRILAKHDPHLFRYWAVDSIDHWRRWPTTWRAYAIALSGWAIVISGVYFLLRHLW